MSTNLILRPVGALLIAVCAIGCDSHDRRYVELSQDAVARQAEQNAQIARQSQQVAEAAHELVQADAQARAELIAAQRSLEEGMQTERRRLDTERDTLEQDRQALATARQFEPIIASTIWSAALLLAVILPLVLCIYLIRSLGKNEPSEDLTELLVCEFTTQQPMLLPPTPADLRRLDQSPPESTDVSQP
jgi:hypothetical protein